MSISPSQIQEMYEIYCEGGTLAEVGSQFGISASYVGQLFSKARLATRRPGPSTNPYVSDLYKFYEQGATLKQVGKEFGVSPSQVRHLFRQAGLDIRSSVQSAALNRKPGPSVKEMYDIYQQGATLVEVGEQFGISASRVGELFKAADLKARSPAEHPIYEMHELYEKGASLKYVGYVYGLSRTRVGELFQSGDLSIRALSVEHPVSEMHELYQRGATLNTVGEQHGITGDRVSQLFKQAGLKVRSRGSRA